MSFYKGLTLEEIIQCLTDQNNEVDSKLLNIFLYTYRSYCEAWDVIQLICKRIHYLNDENISYGDGPSESSGFTKAIIILFNLWLTMPIAQDFYEVPTFRSLNQLLQCTREWPETVLFIKSSASFVHSFKRLEQMIDKVLVNFNTMDSGQRSDYREIAVDCQFRDSTSYDIYSAEALDNKSFFDFTPDLIARSLSFIDQVALQQLKLPELIKHARKLPAPSVLEVINTYNKLYNIVKLSVGQPLVMTRRFDQSRYLPDYDDETITLDNMLSRTNEQRHNVIEKWILTAQILHRLRNFSSLVAIVTALNSTKLKDCMKVFKKNNSTKSTNIYRSLLKAIEPYINQSKEEIPDLERYRSEIPYLGIYLRSMTYINDAFPDYISSTVNVYNGSDEPLINIDKCRRQFDVMAQVKLLISSLNFNNLTEDEAFSNWYNYMQIESKKSLRYGPDIELLSLTLSLESLKSRDSNKSLSKRDQPPFINRGQDPEGHFHRSQENLHHSDLRNKFQSSPLELSQSMSSLIRPDDVNLSNHSTKPKVATVKLKESRNNSNKTNIYKVANFNQSSHDVKSKRKPETISNGSIGVRDRPSLSGLTRSSTVDDKSIAAVLYKKIQIYEKDRTEDFINRVLEKYGKSKLSVNDFDVVQVLAENREITIASNQHLFYALAEKSEYVIEVRRKQITTT